MKTNKRMRTRARALLIRESHSHCVQKQIILSHTFNEIIYASAMPAADCNHHVSERTNELPTKRMNEKSKQMNGWKTRNERGREGADERTDELK